jgi:hypothetical protein
MFVEQITKADRLSGGLVPPFHSIGKQLDGVGINT